MARDTLTGSRIRERRIMVGMKQADLARRADISASYLNLIEHNRRRIGGKLLLSIADVLEVEPTLLTEGAEATLIANLREAATEARGSSAEIDRADEFAGRFPGWAALMADQRRRIAGLERTVKTLTDRMTHDPQLAASLHEMLTTVSAIHSTASILAESDDIEPEWQDRFHRNINEDSARLAETSRSLVKYLDSADDASADIAAPQEEIDAILARAEYHFAALESGEAEPEPLARALTQEASDAAYEMLLPVLERYAEDARLLPRARLQEASADRGGNPFLVAIDLGLGPALVMRRMAVCDREAGLAVCDASGALSFRKPLDQFPFPRFGAACPLLPLYQALSRPMQPVEQEVEQPPPDTARFVAYAIAVPSGPLLPGRTPLLAAHMLVRAVRTPDRPSASGEVEKVGFSCRICPRAACPGRREPSILSGAV